MKRAIKMLLVLLVIIGLSLFFVIKSEGGSTAVLNAITPSSGFTVEKDVIYGDHTRHRIDFYYAADEASADKPLLVFIHGGGWNRGDKSMYKFLAEGLTGAGYDVALPNYRLYPEVKYPAFLDDSAQAIAAITRKEPGRPLVIIGHSAGAYNALMMAFQPQHLKAAGIELCESVAGIVSLASPTGALPAETEPTISIFPDRFMGDDAAINHINRALPPLLLINGGADTSVHPDNAIKLGEALDGRGIAEVIIYPDAGHVDVVKQFSRHFDQQGETKFDVIRFIENLPQKTDGSYCR